MHMKKHELPYKCSSPGCRFGGNTGGFYQLRDLRKHQETHLARPSFRCYFEGCPRSATRHYNMVRHLRKQHGIMVKQGEIAALCRRSS